MNVLKFFSGIALTMGISLSANAFVVNTSLDCSVAVFNPSYDACAGAFVLEGGENDVTNGGDTDIVTTLLNDVGLFGDDDWGFVGKVDDQGYSGTAGAFSVTGIDDTSGQITLMFDVLAELATAELALSFKAAKGFSVYYWNGPIGSDLIEWTTDGVSVKNGNTQDLSHVSLFYRTSDPVDVSEPASAFLVLSGLLSLLIIRGKLKASV